MSGLELELKFPVTAEQVASLRTELRRRGAKPIRMVAAYFDTADGQLARHGMSLRLRREGRRWMQTLKAEGDGAAHRIEHNASLRAAAGAYPTLDLARHEGTDAGAKLRTALASNDAAPVLVERFVTDVSRLGCLVTLPGGVVEAALDQGMIRAGDRTVPVCELELEHKSGQRQALFALADAWRAHGGWWLDTRSKALRGRLLLEGSTHGAPIKARPPRFDGEPDGEWLLRAVVRSVLDQVIGNANELSAGSTDEEHVHQLRVGLRRLRTALRELRPLGHGIDQRWDAPLADVFGRLGELRDDQAVAKAVRPLLERAGAPRPDWSLPDARESPEDVVRDPAFQSALLKLLRFAHDAGQDTGVAPITPAQALEHVKTRLSKLHKQVVAGGRRFEALPSSEQHRVRKRLKRLRYLAEFVQPLWGGKPAQRFLKHLAPAQDALGAHNDIVVAAAKFRSESERDARAWFAAGWLEAHLVVSASAARAALAPLADADLFWKQERRPAAS